MKITSTALSLGLALAGSARAQGITAIAAAIQQVANDITQFDTDVLAYTGGATTTIQTDSDAIVSDTNLAITAVNGSPVLDDSEVEVILPAILALNTTINQAIADLISKKAELAAACAGAQTLNDLNEQLSTATDLANGLTAITPPDLASVAPELSAPIIAAINSGIAAFAGLAPCTTSSTSSPTSSPTSTATSSPATTSPETTATSTGPATSSTPSGPGSNSTSSATSSPSVPVYPTSTPPSYPTGPGSPSGSIAPASSTPCPPGSSSPAGGSPPPYQTGSGSGSGSPSGVATSSGKPGSGSGGNSGSTTSVPPSITNGAGRVGASVGVVLAGVLAVMAM